MSNIKDILKPVLSPLLKSILNSQDVFSSRYFRRNQGGTDFISHSSVTVDRIVMTVDPVSGNSGLPTGAPAVIDNELQIIDFAFSGSISEIGKNGASFFQGIVSNVKYYNSGIQIHGYRIDSNSDDIPDEVGNADGTVINGLASDWGLFQEQSQGGDWLGDGGTPLARR